MDGQFEESLLPLVLPPRNDWSPQETQIFLENLEDFTSDMQGFLGHIRALLPLKTIDQIRNRYIEIMGGLDAHGASLIANVTCNSTMNEREGGILVETMEREKSASSSKRKKCKKSYIRRKPWTVQEHRLFLKGLETFQTRDWNSISKYMVVTKTPTQVASHARRYFRRQAAGPSARRRRNTIHDITTADSSKASLLSVRPVNYLQANTGVVGCQPFAIPNDHMPDIQAGTNNVLEAGWISSTETEVITNPLTNYGEGSILQTHTGVGKNQISNFNPVSMNAPALDYPTLRDLVEFAKPKESQNSSIMVTDAPTIFYPSLKRLMKRF